MVYKNIIDLIFKVIFAFFWKSLLNLMPKLKVLLFSEVMIISNQFKGSNFAHFIEEMIVKEKPSLITPPLEILLILYLCQYNPLNRRYNGTNTLVYQVSLKLSSYTRDTKFFIRVACLWSKMPMF